MECSTDVRGCHTQNAVSRISAVNGPVASRTRLAQHEAQGIAPTARAIQLHDLTPKAAQGSACGSTPSVEAVGVQRSLRVFLYETPSWVVLSCFPKFAPEGTL
jgi:hypothetical protein